VNKLAAVVVCALVGCGVEERADSLLATEPDRDAGWSDAGEAPDSSTARFEADAELAREPGDASVTATLNDAAQDAAALARFVSNEQLRLLADQRCGSCHEAKAPPETGAFPALRDYRNIGDLFPYPGQASRCVGWNYIVPGHPEQSLLYTKLTPNPPCGAHPAMPMPISANEVEMIGDAMRTWGTDGGA
jgi:hypothetical protein